jgi:hypothetical protein
MVSGEDKYENTFYTAVWCTTNESDFKKSIPLEFLGESILRYNSSFKINLVFLEGLHILSENYLKTLEKIGFNIIDYVKPFIEIKKIYKNICNFFSKYEAYCFLRWVVFEEISKSNLSFIHIDSDCILHTALDDIYEFCRNKTFMLQGGPALLSINDKRWFSIFQEELNEFDKNIIRYSHKAFLIKSEININDIVLCNASHYRNPIGSDQDFLEYLISSERIIQNEADVIYSGPFFFIQNPLSIRDWIKFQSWDNFFQSGENYRIEIGGKIVPFIHFQNTFTHFSFIYFIVNKIIRNKILLNKIFRYKINEASFETTYVFKVLSIFFDKYYSRNKTIKYIYNNKLEVKLLNFFL